MPTLSLMLGAACASPTSPEPLPAAPLAPAPAAAPAPAGGAAALTEGVVDLTNAERSRAGLTGLRTSSRLMQAAQLQADQMASLSRLDHVLPGARYPGPGDRLGAAGYAWQAYAENIAMGQRSAAEVLASWMQSSGHRANILNGNLTEIGTGYATDGAGRPYWVQVFGRPSS